MTDNTFFRHSIRLIMAVLVLVMSVPSAASAAEKWSYPTKEPSEPFGGGNGKQDNPYIISTAQHLANLAYMVSHKDNSYKGKYFLQTRDIVLNDDVISGATKDADGSVHYAANKAHFDNMERWQPIGMYGYIYDSDFMGVYDGGGHSISGVYCRKPIETSSKAYHFIGLFGNCDKARISNLTVKDSFFSLYAPDDKGHKVSIGSLVGYAMESTFTNCHVDNCVTSGDGDITVSQWDIGGLIGRIEEVTYFSNCSYNGIIDAYALSYGEKAQCNMGGFIGYKEQDDYDTNHLYLTDCQAQGKVTCRVAGKTERKDGKIFAGGLIGNNHHALSTGELTRCVNYMDINVFPDGSQYADFYIRAGGVCAGFLNAVECANYGNINIGGTTFRERTDTNSILVSGVSVKEHNTNCFNYGDISLAPMPTCKYVYLGPWATGYDGHVTDCFNYGKITYSFQDTDPTYPKIYLEKIDDVVYFGYSKFVRHYTTINGTVKSNDIKESDFTDPDYAVKLNAEEGKCMYGIVREGNERAVGKLSLTSLGATVNALDGSGSEADPYLIKSAHDLEVLRNTCDGGQMKASDVYKLAANIDMSGEGGIEPIGSDEHPFTATFDGGGHYIRGLRSYGGCLFGTMKGTVQNLAIDGSRSLTANKFAGIADQVQGGTIKGCYVVGDASLRVQMSGTGAAFGGICNNLSGGKIEHCYYIGNVTADNKDAMSDRASVHIGGIAASATGSITGCYAIMRYSTPTTSKPIASYVGGIAASANTASGFAASNNVYCLDVNTTQEKYIPAYDGTTAKDTEGDIKAADLATADGTAQCWAQGCSHPILKNAYHYVCKDHEGNEALLDLAPRTPADNDILTLVPTADQKTDTKMWQLPNVAVFSEEYNAEMLTNFSIVPGSPLRYKASADGVSVKGLATYPWVVKKNAVNLRTFCLPGAVELAGLPEGCRLYVGGKLTSDDSKAYTLNIVEVETVPAGVPFLLRYDNTTDADTLYITMTGDLAMTPQKADESSELQGTYKSMGGVYKYDLAYEETAADGETKMYMKKKGGPDAFSAYVDDANTERIELSEYLLLDEQSNHTDVTVADNDGHTVKVKMRRSFKTGGWNTLCLPFSVPVSAIRGLLGEGTHVEELYQGSVSQTGVIELKFRSLSASDNIEAGKPYLVYPEKEVTIADLGKCAIDNTLTPTSLDLATDLTLSMIGSYGKVSLLSTDEASHYFIQQDKFYRVVGSPIVSGGFRCWFKVTDGSGTKAQTLGRARIIHGDGTATDIRLVDTAADGSGDTRVYDTQGIRHKQMQRGLNIVGGKKVVKQ